MYHTNIFNEYSENEKYGNGYRITYLKGIKRLVEQRKKECLETRQQYTQRILQNQSECRKEYLDMLGWPLNVEPKPILSVTENKIFENDSCVFSRMQFELFEGYQFYGILFRHKTEQALPLVISQHGGGGTPELCSSFFCCENYNDMSMRIFHKGVNVFAPQLLLWSKDRFGTAGERNDMDLTLKQLGGSIVALEIYSISRCLDYFEEQAYCNRAFGMSGLSYGGFYTLYTAAADTRIKTALACSHFNDRTVYKSPDKVWFNAANSFLDSQLALLVSPRFLRVEVGDNDELFEASLAEKEFKTVRKHYQPSENVQFHIFKGVHEFCPEDDGIEEMLSRLS